MPVTIPTYSFPVSQTKMISQNSHCCFLVSFIHYFDKRLLNTNSLPDNMLDTGYTQHA